MKQLIRWTSLYVFAAATMFALLAVVDMARGTAFADAWKSALLWAVISAAIFTGAQYHKASKLADCAVCDRLQGKS